MPRVKRGSKRRNRRKKFLSLTKGQFQRRSKLYRYAKEASERSLKFAYIGRRLKKRDFRSLWIIRIGAAARQHGMTYSKFMHGLSLAEIELNRKMLAEMAAQDPDAFAKIAAVVREKLAAKGVPLADGPAYPEPDPIEAAAVAEVEEATEEEVEQAEASADDDSDEDDEDDGDEEAGDESEADEDDKKDD